MRNRKLYQLGVAVKIWLLAVGINAILDSLLMSIHNSAGADLELFWFLSVLCGIFSFPVLMMITIVIWLLSGNASGKWLFWFVLAVGVLTTILMFVLVWGILGEGDKKVMFMFPGIAVVSGIAAVTTFYRSLLKCGNDFTTAPKINDPVA